VLFIFILAYVLMSYFMDPYHPLRLFVARIVEPLLNPIRQIIPPVGMVDFSPLVLLLLVQLVGRLLVGFIASF
jgi:YggT family protein